MPDQSPDAARELFEQLLELPEAEREARLQELTIDDVALEARVRRLLEAHERATGFDSVIPTPPDIALPDPDNIGPYRVLEKLGEGGMGVVYLGEQKKPVRRRVAIKIVRPGMASAEVINRFNAERQALALMSHPGISRILDAGATENGLPYFVMEYVPGVPLIRYCDEHRLTLRQRVSLARLVCLAVQHAHQKGVIHRDLKPSNILVVEDDGDPLPKIIDFGIAKAMSQPLTDGTLHTRIGKLIGTPDYMSPEQCNSGSVDVDTRSDVYSLGVLLYQLLSSQLPYDFDRSKDNEVTILRRIVEEDPPPPSRRARDAAPEDAASRGLGDVYSLERRIRGELDWIVSKALERDRNRRYESAQALADDLERFLDNELVAAGPPSMGYRAGKFVRRHALGVSIVGISFLMLTAFAALMAWQVSQTELQRDRANREAEIAKQVTRFTAGLFELASPSESGNPDVTARELLDIGVRQLDLDTASEAPEIRAALFEAAGQAYLGLGIYDEAERLLTEAVRLRREHSGNDPATLVSALISLEHLWTEHGKLEDAEVLGREALEIAGTLPPEENRLLLRAAEEYAETLRELDRLEEAATLLEKYINDPQRDEKYDPEYIAGVMSQYGRIQEELGNLDIALTYLEDALSRLEDITGSMSQWSNSTRSRLAATLVLLDRPEEGAALYRLSLENAIRLYGDSHREVSTLWNNLGYALSDIPERRDEAIDAYQQSLRIKETIFDDLHPDVLITKSNLAWLYRVTGRLDEAATIYGDVVDARRRIFGPRHLNTANAQAGLATVRILQGRDDEAAPLLDEAIGIFTEILGERNWRTATLYRTRGVSLMQQERFDEAERELALAHDILVETLGAEHSQTVSTQERIDELFRKQDRLILKPIE